MTNKENRIRLTILGGFLGAGKSTWLRHQLYTKAYVQPHVIVNEVASHAVDDTLLTGARHLDVLAGGCVCCDQKDKMIALLRQICNERSRKNTEPQTQHLVFEMSGVADPGSVYAAIQNDPVLARHVALEEIIVIVDALHGLKQLKDEVLARAQIEAADRIIITKVDNCSEYDLAKLVATLRQVTAIQDFRISNFGVEEKLPNIPNATAIDLSTVKVEANQLPLTSLPIDLDQLHAKDDIWVGFSIWLSAMLNTHGDQIIRVKGVVLTPSGRLLLQSVRKIMQVPERIPSDHGDEGRTSDGTIVLIGRGLDADRITRSLYQTIELTDT